MAGPLTTKVSMSTYILNSQCSRPDTQKAGHHEDQSEQDSQDAYPPRHLVWYGCKTTACEQTDDEQDELGISLSHVTPT